MEMQKLLNIQRDLKAPKSQYNSFGKYNYRNCEDILEAVKPLCAREKACLTISDEVVQRGDRYYIQATATLHDAETGGIIALVTAYAREEAEKKGMDGSQVTGAASSYARKYALNGLFDIDDTKDADSDEKGEKPAKSSSGAAKTAAASKKPSEADKPADKPKFSLDEAMNTEVTLHGVAYKLGALKQVTLEWYAEKSKNTELREKAALILRHRFAEELKDGTEETPFGN